jgi:Peptidase propeptide and YPEB domain
MEVHSDWKCIMTRCKLLVPAAICVVGGAGVVSAYTGEELAKYAKVTLAEARAIALKAFPGKITDEELEKEKGGSGLRYSFDIKNGGVTHEVGVDAKTGKLLENSVEVAVGQRLVPAIFVANSSLTKV